MTCTHEIDVGAYVLDILDPPEQRAMDRHLPHCGVCIAAYADLVRLAPTLAAVRRPGTSAPVPALGGGTSGPPARRPRSTGSREGSARRWLLAAAAGATVALGAAAGIEATTRPGPLPQAVAATSGAVRVQARIAPHSSGSAITLTLTGVESGEQCELIAVGRDGRRQTASVWTATYERTAQVTGTVPMPPRDLRRLVVQTLDGRTLAAMSG